MRRSLLGQLLGGYLLFAALVLGTGASLSVLMQQQVTGGVQAADLALAQTIALETTSKIAHARQSVAELAQVSAVQRGDEMGMQSIFAIFKAARPDLDRVYWLDREGVMRVSEPTTPRTLGTDFSDERFFRLAATTEEPFVEAGIVDLTTFNAVVIVAQPVHNASGSFAGVVATNLLLDDLSAPLKTVAEDQARQGQPLRLGILDRRGHLIATTERERLLQPMLGELPGADEALAGSTATRFGSDLDGRSWLFSSTPVPGLGWAVVVQRPEQTALAALGSLYTWLYGAALICGLGGLLFWLVLVRRVIEPLQLLAARHSELHPPGPIAATPIARLISRHDEVGELARSLALLEADVEARLTQLRTLLETSSAVVSTLDPGKVAAAIIHEVRRLVDLQAAAVLVPRDDGALHVLASVGRSPQYDRMVHIGLNDPASPSALALRERIPVQMIAGESSHFPSTSYGEGFRAILAVPIISRHAGAVVLLVSRTEPRRFSDDEVDLLLAFANHATLAWEHAVLYERSDERLQEIARENAQLYQQARAEKQTLAAIMGSMSDGLVLTGMDGRVLYANRGASAIIGLNSSELECGDVEAIHERLRTNAIHPENYDRGLSRTEAGAVAGWLLEREREGHSEAISLRIFQVRDEDGQAIGRGLLLRDVTREREVEQFKTTLLGAVGHELRTPLAAIKGHASTLLQDDVIWSAEDQRHFLTIISDEADRLAGLVSNLLDLSRLEAGLLLLNRDFWRLEELTSGALQRLGRPIPRLIIELPPDLPPVEVDRPRIEVVLRNLLSNAVAYGEGAVMVRAHRENGAVIVGVSDDGPGITPTDLPHIFERFYRASSGVQRRAGGSGLGLAICKAFVEAHGGRIWAESSAGGTTIRFTLPVDH